VTITGYLEEFFIKCSMMIYSQRQRVDVCALSLMKRGNFFIKSDIPTLKKLMVVEIK